MRRLVVVAVVVAVLVRSGEALPVPPVDAARWPAWAEELGPVAAAMALVRVAALVAAAWVAAAATIAAVATWLGAAPVAALAGRALPAPLRRAAAGVGVASAVALGGAPMATAAPAQEPVVLVPADGTATMRVLPPDEPPPAPSPAPAPAPVVEDTWTVEPGDSFWSIAVDVVAAALGRAPTDAEVDRYWRALVDANRDRLVTPNPDLVVPGQVFVLPTL